jgi:hypothetical protein
MSNFVVAVGGTGAKLMQSLIHLGAAGMFPPERPDLSGLLVDPDESNGNIDECKTLQETYQACENLAVGKTDLFRSKIKLTGPWTPLTNQRTDTLRDIFNYNQLANNGSEEAELMDLFFERGELGMSVKQGFRGRPAIGAAVFANSVNFDRDPWKDFHETVKNAGAVRPPHILFAGSVFGGSGASGVPTLVRLVSTYLQKDAGNARYGLILFLPFFQFRQIEGEAIQADPASFPTATAEALKYYNERGFLQICRSMYALGEEVPAEMAVSAVGAKEQRNEAHFIELLAALGAVRFFDDDIKGGSNCLAVAARAAEGTLTWDDLPSDKKLSAAAIRAMHDKLQKMAIFAVAYHYIFYPQIEDALKLRPGESKIPWWRDYITNKGVTPDEARGPLGAVDAYTVKFLEWLLHISTPRRPGFEAGLVNPNVFGVEQDRGNWRLRMPREFQQAELGALLRNRPKTKVSDRGVIKRASGSRVKDDNAEGPGLLVRALFDACEVE